MSSVLEIRALKWVPLALAAAVALSGCARDGFYHDRNLDYTEAAPAPPLVLPETRNTQRYRDALPVPQAATQGTLDEAAEIRPPQSLAIGSGLEPEYVERREVGDQTWLVVAADTGTVWPQLEEFVRSRQLNVLQSSASQGVIVTSQGEIRLQSALRAGSSEVRCESGGQTMTSCLDALESHLSARSASASVSSSWTAQRLTDEQTLQVRQQGEEWEVVIPQPVDRVWAELNHYLELDFAQEGQRDLLASDPSSHEFLVEYMTETERNRNPLQIVFSADVRKMSQEIRLALQPDGDKTILRAINASERAFSADDQLELLERVSGYLR
ncbi:outer membrane protein assembly factor BamC [Vreelandella maris]|uniref:Outer membrane protein assembly factor BamC n=1 Tax=Vreelandella maris TaxID=2729617 RepID=A0A7Y6RA18_9GAMM|nr:outer membrane protein assembly factor BamC [Halomonas maris]NVF13162.1 outer membrane protein assembly factor BamC [Halomonas maris]